MKLVLFVSILLVVGCKETGQSTQSDVPVDPKDATKLVKLNKFDRSKLTYRFNNAVFEINATSLKAGGKVFNKSMGEHGALTGKLVIVSEKIPKLLIEQNFKISKIAEHTWVVKVNSDSNLYVLYKILLQLESVSNVEISVNYSGITPSPEMM